MITKEYVQDLDKKDPLNKYINQFVRTDENAIWMETA
jgi:hypothetical protein